MPHDTPGRKGEAAAAGDGTKASIDLPRSPPRGPPQLSCPLHPLPVPQIQNLDCWDLLQTVPTGSIDCLLTDPPYGTTDLQWDQVPDLSRLWVELKRVLKPGSPAILFAAQPFTTDLINSNRKWFKFCWIWKKRLPSGFANAKKRPLKDTEDVVVFCEKSPPYFPQGLKALEKPRHSNGLKKGGHVRGDSFREDHVQTHTHYPRTVLEYPHDPRPNLHPTQKPVDLLAYLLRTHTRPGHLVLDPFLGSGSTAVACHREGRRFVGGDREPRYVVAARGRLGNPK